MFAVVQTSVLHKSEIKKMIIYIVTFTESAVGKIYVKTRMLHSFANKELAESYRDEMEKVSEEGHYKVTPLGFETGLEPPSMKDLVALNKV